MSTTHNAPQGDLVLRTLAMPADTNANGDIFGGWLMSQMDIGGAILAKEIAHGRVVTVRVEGMTFLRPVASDSGPHINWPIAIPKNNALMTSCAWLWSCADAAAS